MNRVFFTRSSWVETGPNETEQVHRRADPAIVKEGEAGRRVADLCRTHGITEQTYYRCKVKFGGRELSEMQRLKALEDEDRRLKRIVAEQTLDIQALKAVVAKNGEPRLAAIAAQSRLFRSCATIAACSMWHEP